MYWYDHLTLALFPFHDPIIPRLWVSSLSHVVRLPLDASAPPNRHRGYTSTAGRNPNEGTGFGYVPEDESSGVRWICAFALLHVFLVVFLFFVAAFALLAKCARSS